MLDTMLDQYSKAVESTLKLQQEMLRKWTDELAPTTSAPVTPASPPAGPAASASATLQPMAALHEQLQAARQKWEEAITEMLNRHRETLDEQYRAGIRILEDAFRLAKATDHEEFRRLSEELWRRSVATLETAVSSQVHDAQATFQKWMEVTATGMKESMEQFHDKS